MSKEGVRDTRALFLTDKGRKAIGLPPGGCKECEEKQAEIDRLRLLTTCEPGCTFPEHLRGIVPHECNPTYSPMPPLNAWKSRAQLQAERKARQMEMEAEVEL